MEYNQDALRLLLLLSPKVWASFDDLIGYVPDAKSLSALLLKGNELGIIEGDFDAWRLKDASVNQETIRSFIMSNPSIEEFTLFEIKRFGLAKHLPEELLIKLISKKKEIIQPSYCYEEVPSVEKKEYSFISLNKEASDKAYQRNHREEARKNRVTKKDLEYNATIGQVKELNEEIKARLLHKKNFGSLGFDHFAMK